MDIISLLQDRAKQLPHVVQFTFLINDEQQKIATNLDLYQKVHSAASALSKQANNEPVILMYGPGLDFVIGLLACLASGNIAVPIAIPKPQQLDQTRKILSNSKAQVILSEKSLIERFESEFPGLRWTELETHHPHAKYFPTKKKEDVAIIQYTSGSTGVPKGVSVTYQNLSHNILAIIDHFGLTAKSISMSWLPHYHDMGLIDGILQPLITGCHGILTSPRQVIGKPEFWLDCISKYKVTHTGGPNFFFNHCVDKIKENSDWDLSSLRAVYVSAEPVRLETLEKFAEKFQPSGFIKSMFTPGYGLAECTLMVSCKRAGTPLKFADFKLPTGTVRSVALGHPIPEIELKIIEPETQQEVAREAPGEVWVKWPSCAKGYWNNPKETKNSYIQLGKTQGWVKTGDIGIVKDAQLYLVGRLKDLIIINGVNHYAEDLEYTISSRIADLARESCLAFSIEQAEKEELVILIKVLSKTAVSDLRKLKNDANSILFHEFGLAGVNIYFHTGPAYAKTTSGKIKRDFNKTLFLRGTFELLSEE